MMHMSTALGVNCTFCHNSRQFANWAAEPAAARHRLARHPDGAATSTPTTSNPLTNVFPANRKGPEGDV